MNVVYDLQLDAWFIVKVLSIICSLLTVIVPYQIKENKMYLIDTSTNFSLDQMYVACVKTTQQIKTTNIVIAKNLNSLTYALKL